MYRYGLMEYEFLTREETKDDPILDNLHSTVKIYNIYNNSGGLGTGFIVDDRGYGLTCNHIFNWQEDWSEIRIEVYGDETQYHPVFAYSIERLDITIFKIDTGRDLRPVTFVHNSSHTVKLRDKVYTIGHPVHYHWTISEGIITSVKSSILVLNSKFFLTNLDIQPGNSGGAVYNEHGECIGVVYGGVSDMGMLIRMNFVFESNVIRFFVWEIIKAHQAMINLGYF
jgi:S1-C subfamily serine protease